MSGKTPALWIGAAAVALGALAAFAIPTVRAHRRSEAEQLVPATDPA